VNGVVGEADQVYTWITDFISRTGIVRLTPLNTRERFGCNSKHECVQFRTKVFTSFCVSSLVNSQRSHLTYSNKAGWFILLLSFHTTVYWRQTICSKTHARISLVTPISISLESNLIDGIAKRTSLQQKGRNCTAWFKWHPGKLNGMRDELDWDSCGPVHPAKVRLTMEATLISGWNNTESTSLAWRIAEAGWDSIVGVLLNCQSLCFVESV